MRLLRGREAFRRSFLGIAATGTVVVLAAISVFLIVRQAAVGGGVSARPQATVLPGTLVCGKTFGPAGEVVESYCLPGSPPSEFWYVPLLEADSKKPRANGVVNGMLIGPSVQPRGGPCDTRLPDGRLPSPTPAAASEATGTELEVRPKYLPVKTDFVSAEALRCGAGPAGLSWVEMTFHVRPDPASLGATAACWSYYARVANKPRKWMFLLIAWRVRRWLGAGVSQSGRSPRMGSGIQR